MTRDSKSMPAWLVATLSLAVTGAGCAAAPAREPPPTDPSALEKTLARRKYSEGDAAFRAGNYREAVRLLTEADRLIPDAAFAFDLFEAHRALGNVPEMLYWARECLKRSPNGPDRAEMEASVKQAERLLQARGVQQVTITTVPDGGTCSVDGRAPVPTPWTGELEPGTHIVDARRYGSASVRLPFELRPDKALALAITLGPSSRDADSKDSGALVEPSEPEGHPGVATQPVLLVTGGVVVGVGVTTLAIALGLESARAGAQRHAESAEVQVDAHAAMQAMDRYQLGARASASVGAALFVLGGAILGAGAAVPSAGEAMSAGTPALATSCDWHGCSAVLSGSLF